MALLGDVPPDFRPDTLRGAPGFFRVGRTPAGQWWLVDPEGRPFFARGVHGVRAEAESTHDPAARLRAWGCNTLGCGSDRLYLEDGLAFTPAVDFCTGEGLIQLAGVRLPDVFDPMWPQRALARAATVCAPLAGERTLLGWFTDDCPGWPHQPAAPRPGLLQVCLSLEPALAAYHAAWEFVLALHGGRLEALARAWGTALPNKEVLRELTRHDHGLVTRGYLRDEARWTAEFARRYFTAAVTAIRAHDANHLVLGCRWGGPTALGLRAAGAPPAADVMVLDAADLAETGTAAADPVLLADFSWVPEMTDAAPASRRGHGLTTVERMLRHGRLALGRAVAHPAVVGYCWSQWADRAGEQPPFAGGLVHANDTEAREHTELLTGLNLRVEELRHLATVRNQESP
jgi:hypothetical protein